MIGRDLPPTVASTAARRTPFSARGGRGGRRPRPARAPRGSTSRCARARSSASRASRGTASVRWPRSSSASAAPGPGGLRRAGHHALVARRGSSRGRLLPGGPAAASASRRGSRSPTTSSRRATERLPGSGRLLLSPEARAGGRRGAGERFDIRGADLDAPARRSPAATCRRSCSRASSRRPALLVAAQPTRGSTSARRRRRGGCCSSSARPAVAVLVISEDLDELFASPTGSPSSTRADHGSSGHRADEEEIGLGWPAGRHESARRRVRTFAIQLGGGRGRPRPVGARPRVDRTSRPGRRYVAPRGRVRLEFALEQTA